MTEPVGLSAPSATGRPHGSARAVLDYLAWYEHCLYIDGLCDSTLTAVAVFNTFEAPASAERGRNITGVPTV